MKYTVLWRRAAERRLAELWINAPDRQAVADAANRIDATLRIDPETRGESRDGGRRVLIDAPLGVVFRVLPDDRTVWVIAVWAIS